MKEIHLWKTFILEKDKLKPMPCIVCGQSAVLSFISGYLLYKQETIFLSVDIQKKVWESQGENCVTVKYIKHKSERLRKKGRQWGKYWHQIFLFCCGAKYIFFPCCIFELLSQKEFPYSTVCNIVTLFLTSEANLTQFQVFLFNLMSFSFLSRVVTVIFLCITNIHINNQQENRISATWSLYLSPLCFSG